MVPRTLVPTGITELGSAVAPQQVPREREPENQGADGAWEKHLDNVTDLTVLLKNHNTHNPQHLQSLCLDEPVVTMETFLGPFTVSNSFLGLNKRFMVKSSKFSCLIDSPTEQKISAGGRFKSGRLHHLPEL